MRKRKIHPFLAGIAVLLTLGGSACSEKEVSEAPAHHATEPAASMSSDSTKLVAPADTPATTETTTATTSATAGSVVLVDFRGPISTVIRENDSRAVFIADPHHAVRLLIKRPTIVHEVREQAVAALQEAFGPGAVVGCSANECTVQQVQGLAFRVVDSNGSAIQPGLDADNPEFTMLVPSLTRISGLTTLDPNIDVFPPSGDFTNFFELNGGTLGARPYCRAVELVGDRERPGQHRDFPEVVTLIGSTSGTATLQFSSNGTEWKTVPLQRASVLSIELENRPATAAAGDAHFELHGKVVDGTTETFPRVDTIERCVVGTAVGCGQTRYP